MSVLVAIETTSNRSSVAMLDDDVLTERIHDAPRGHVEFCMPAILDLVGARGLAAIDRIAVGVGPGAFTGMRVGVQTAKTLAHTLDVPLIAVSSLEALAAADVQPGAILACMHAFRGEVFAALFERGGDGTLQRRSEDAVLSPAEAAALAAEHAARILGTGPERFPEQLGEIAATYPSAAEVARIAATGGGTAVDALTLEPRYLRRSEAEIRWGDTGVVAKRPDRIRFRTVTR